MLHALGPPCLSTNVSGGGNMKRRTAVTISIFALAAAFAGDVPYAGGRPKDGFVPDAKTAIKIAVAVWGPVYGAKKSVGEKPFRARLLTDAVWTGEGFLPPGTLGGVV